MSNERKWHRFLATDADEPTLKIFDKQKIGMYETIGHPKHRRYQNQEDALIAFLLPEFLKLTQPAKTTSLASTVDALQEKYGMDFQGSTLNGTITWKQANTVFTFTTNVGDSTSFMVVIDSQKKVKAASMLNTLHIANHPSKEEKERIQNAGEDIFLQGGRLHKRGLGSLAITRAIGDNDFEKGISHTPDVTQNEFTLETDDLAVLIVACDGLTEADALTLDGIANIVSQYVDQPETCAKTLAQTAAEISTDNISVAVAPIVSEIPVGIFVFDGHGGKEVSNHLGNHLYAKLLTIIKNKS